MSMIVREATAADAAAIARIQVASWRATYRGIIDEQALSGLSVDDKQAYWLQWFLRSEPSRFMRVIDDDARAVGFAVAGPARGQPARPIDLPAVGEIYVLYLSPGVHRRGWGTQLVQSMARGLRRRGLESLVMWVLQRNHGACRFYEALGGTAAYRRRTAVGRQHLVEVGYVWDDLDEVIAPSAARSVAPPTPPAPRREDCQD